MVAVDFAGVFAAIAVFPAAAAVAVAVLFAGAAAAGFAVAAGLRVRHAAEVSAPPAPKAGEPAAQAIRKASASVLTAPSSTA
jgi:hypothetical protein